MERENNVEVQNGGNSKKMNQADFKS